MCDKYHPSQLSPVQGERQTGKASQRGGKSPGKTLHRNRCPEPANFFCKFSIKGADGVGSQVYPVQ